MKPLVYQYLSLAALGLATLTSCHKGSIFSRLQGDSRIDALVAPRFDLETVTARMAKTGPDASKRSPFIINGSDSIQVACADERQQNDILTRVGFSASYIRFTLDSQQKLQSKGVLDCDRGQAPSFKRYYYRYHDATKNRTLYYVVEPNTNKVFLLGCQALVDGFGFTGVAPENDETGSEISNALDTEGTVISLSCLKGKEINPDAGEFIEDTVAKKTLNLQAGDSDIIPLGIKNLRADQDVEYSLDTNTASVCNPDLVWHSFAGRDRDQLIIGTKPTLSPYSCQLNLRATVDSVLAQPLSIEINARPKTFDKVWTFGPTICTSTNNGAVKCWGTTEWSLPARGEPVKDLIVGIYYMCALYKSQNTGNLACEYKPQVNEALKNARPKGHVTAIAGTLSEICAAEVKGDPSNKDQTVSCWKADTSSVPNDGSLPEPFATRETTVLSLLTGGNLCYDTVEGVSNKRKILCINDAAFSNAQGTPVGEQAKGFNIVDTNAAAGFTLEPGQDLDLQRAFGLGCTIHQSKVGCWGWNAGNVDEVTTAENLGKVAAKPGSLRYINDTICFEELSPQPNANSKVQCWKRASLTALQAPYDLGRILSYDASIIGGRVEICSVNREGSTLTCTNNRTKSLKDLVPEGAYWTKKLNIAQ